MKFLVRRAKQNTLPPPSQEEEQAAGADEGAAAGAQPRMWREIQGMFLPQVVDLFKKNCTDMAHLDKMLKGFVVCCEGVPNFLKPKYAEMMGLFLEIAGTQDLGDENWGLVERSDVFLRIFVTAGIGASTDSPFCGGISEPKANRREVRPGDRERQDVE